LKIASMITFHYSNKIPETIKLERVNAYFGCFGGFSLWMIGSAAVGL
jgi:hypothetical protein